MKEKYFVVVEDCHSVDDSIQIYNKSSEEEAKADFEKEVEYQWKNRQEDTTYKNHNIYLCKILSEEEIPSNPTVFVPEKVWKSS